MTAQQKPFAKAFYSQSLERLEESINNYLQELEDDEQVVSLQYQSSFGSHYALLLTVTNDR